MTHDDVERGPTYEALGRAQVVVDHERWRHVLDRHPELDEMLEAVNDLIKAPDEVFVDPHDTFHLIKKLTDGPSDFLVAIVRRNGPKVRLITAYCTNVRRKERRYRKFRKLALS